MSEGRSFSEQEEAEGRMSKRKVISLVILCILAVCGVILFMLTQDMTRTMVFVDFWTLLHAIFIALQIVALILLVRNVKAIVSFDVSTGRRPIKEKIPFGELLEEPKTPVRRGYSFDGWYTDSFFNNPWDFTHPVDRNITLYAKWSGMEQQPIASSNTQVAPV